MSKSGTANRISSEEVDQKLWMSLGALAVALVILSFTAFRGGRPSCKYFIPSIYMYLIISILLVGIFTLVHEKGSSESERGKTYERDDPASFSNFTRGIFYGLGVLVVMILYFAMDAPSWMNHWLNHGVWLFILYGLSFGFYALYKLRLVQEYLTNAILYVVVLFFVMSGIVYANAKKFQKMSNSLFAVIGSGLLAALLTIIISSLILLFAGATSQISLASFVSFQKIILYIAIFIFALFLSFDTVYILKRTKTCDERSPKDYPNYPMESFMIFINLYNILTDILQLRILSS